MTTNATTNQTAAQTKPIRLCACGSGEYWLHCPGSPEYGVDYCG